MNTITKQYIVQIKFEYLHNKFRENIGMLKTRKERGWTTTTQDDLSETYCSSTGYGNMWLNEK